MVNPMMPQQDKFLILPNSGPHEQFWSNKKNALFIERHMTPLYFLHHE